MTTGSLRAAPIKIELTPEQVEALEPLFAMLATDTADRMAIMAQVSRDAAFVMILPAAAARKIRGVLSDYKSSIAALQPNQDPTGEAYADYKTSMTRVPYIADGNGGARAWYEIDEEGGE